MGKVRRNMSGLSCFTVIILLIIFNYVAVELAEEVVALRDFQWENNCGYPGML